MLTPRQLQVLDFITEFINQYQFSPTTKEIALGINIKSRGVVYRHLLALQAADKIDLLPGKNRNIVLKKDDSPSQSLQVPLLGAIAAGAPIEAIAHQESLDLAKYFAVDSLFALVVKGDSMIDLGIHDGDIAICEPAQTAAAGDIVVALVDKEEVTLKRIEYLQDGLIKLCPANKLYEPLVFNAEQVIIQGRYVGVLRRA